MAATNDLDPVLTSEAARILTVAPETVRLWEKRGLLPAIKTIGGVRLFNRPDVEALARSREAMSARGVPTASVSLAEV